VQASQGNATARLLQSKGASAPEIQAAIAGGPDTLKALLGQYMGKDKFAVVQTKEVEDQYGGKRKVFKIFNANDGTFKDIPANSAAEAKWRLARAAGRSDAGPEKPGARRSLMAASHIRRCRARPMQRRSARPCMRPIRQFDAVNYKSRQATRQKFTKGKGADNLTAFNTAIGHLGSLDKSIDHLNNSGFPAWNNMSPIRSRSSLTRNTRPG
jgi:hypothetical protein